MITAMAPQNTCPAVVERFLAVFPELGDVLIQNARVGTYQSESTIYTSARVPTRNYFRG